MTHTASPLTTGRPIFPLSVRTDAADPAVAWRQVLEAEADPVQGLSGVSGDFAVGLALADGRIVLAVDRFAIRTLCWRIVNGELRFAERAAALADAIPEIDPQAIYEYLYFHNIPSPRTIYRGVHRLPPGHCAVFEHGRMTVTRYWRPAFNEGSDTSFESLRERFRALLKASVADRLAGSDRGACFLSGGTDSSTVTGMIRQVTGRAPATFSIGFDAEGYDEMAYARIAARHFGAEHHEYYLTPDDLLRSIGDVAGHYDQPFGNSSTLPSYYCARAVKAEGFTQVLGGDGGDELFGGNSRYAKQRIFGWYDKVPALMRSALVEPLFADQGNARLALLRKGASYIEQARVPMPDRLEMYNLLLHLGISTVLENGFVAAVATEEPARQQRRVWAEANATSPVNRTLAFDWRYTLAENDLPKVRGATQLAGLAVAFPFLDQRLVDFSLALPSDYKLKGLKLRWFFKEALRGFLPEETIAKKKQGFGLPFGPWLTRHAGLRGFASDALHNFARRGIVRPAFIERLFSHHLAEHPGYYGEMIWILTMLEHWLQRHAPGYVFEGAAPASAVVGTPIVEAA